MHRLALSYIRRGQKIYSGSDDNKINFFARARPGRQGIFGCIHWALFPLGECQRNECGVKVLSRSAQICLGFHRTLLQILCAPFEVRDQIRRMPQREMADHSIRGRVDLVLPIEGIQQGGPDFLKSLRASIPVGRHLGLATALVARSNSG
jgi:hypothetical protein